MIRDLLANGLPVNQNFVLARLDILILLAKSTGRVYWLSIDLI